MPAETSVHSDLPRRWSRWLPFLVIAVAVLAAPLVGSVRSAEAGHDAPAPDDEALRAGAEVYSAVCASCHQPGGVGLPGQFPPLVDNPNVDDAEYMEDVIRNGLSGPIEINGETYDSVMPPQTLTDADIANVITYIQSGFASPAAPAPEADTGPVAGTDLPTITDWTYYIAYALAAVFIAIVFGSRIIGKIDRREVSWLDAWLKTGVIVVGLIVSIVILPAKFIELGFVQDMSRNVRDLLTVGIWSGALAVSLFVLWYAHRERRI